MKHTSFQFTFEAIGTHWIIDVYDAPPDVSQDRLLATIRRRINAFDRRYSRFRTDTMVNTMSRSAGTYAILPRERPLIQLYEQLYYLTNGQVTPLIGQILEDTGYDAHYSLHSKSKIKSAGRWEDFLLFNNKSLTIKKPVLLDFGAAGKGFLVDEVSRDLLRAGNKSFCVDAGGDMYYHNQNNESIEVGLEHPVKSDQIIGSVLLSNASICGSAGNRRAWGKYHHIINPHTLSSPTHILAVWVIAASAMLADALATSLYFVSPHDLKPFKFDYIILQSDYTVLKSDNLNVKLYYN